MDDRVIPYPMKLRPLFVPKVWGGRRLGSILGRSLPGAAAIGEEWVAWDGLRVSNGALAGTTLSEVTARIPELIFESSPSSAADGAFPLLAKFIDARENLSIQVHPDDAYARSREGQPYGKCEMWYVLQADPGAAVFQGFRRPLARTDLIVLAGDGRIVDCLERVPVKPGDVLINTPGTIHALSAGVVIYELQQSCDLTYRIYDWGRGGSNGRALHLDRAADVSWLQPLTVHQIEPAILVDSSYRSTLLVACRYFAAELVDLPAGGRVPREAPQMRILTVIEGNCRVAHPELAVGSSLLRPGQSIVVPRGVSHYELKTTSSRCRLIDGYVPDLVRDVVRPLRAGGYSNERILQLGGEPDRSDLRGVLIPRAL